MDRPHCLTEHVLKFKVISRYTGVLKIRIHRDLGVLPTKNLENSKFVYLSIENKV